MAEIFACPTCGSTEYELTKEATGLEMQDSSGASAGGAGTQDSVRKRKRSTSCERDWKQSR